MENKNTMTAFFEIKKGIVEKVNGLQEIIEVMFYEGIEQVTTIEGNLIQVYDNGTFHIK